MTRKILLFSVLIPFLTGCNSDISYYDKQETESVQNLKHLLSRSDSKSEFSVTFEEIENVIHDYYPDRKLSRSSNLDYKVSSINNSEGNPIVYVINFGDGKGFLLISATKKMPPVLAFNDKGNFNVDGNMPDGLIAWKEMMINRFEIAETMPMDSVRPIAMLWQRYEVRTLGDTTDPDESLFNDPDFRTVMEKIQTRKSTLASQGAEIYEPGSIIGFDESFSNEIWNNAKESVYPAYMDNWQWISFVAYLETVEEHNVDNFVDTEWHQESPYNKYCFTSDGKQAVAGCAPIAAAQIMNYYRHPAQFDWNEIGKGNENEIARLISEIGVKSNTTYGIANSNTKYDDLVNTMKNYGYLHFTLVNPDNVLLGMNPVFIRGAVAGTTDGHSWIATGIKQKERRSRYILVYGNKRNDITDTEYNNVYNYTDTQYYMNWGWKSFTTTYYNGWYNAGNIYKPDHINDQYTNISYSYFIPNK